MAAGNVSERRLGVTNGLDLSPDGATLYVSEPNTRQVWAYTLDGTKLVAPRLVKQFAGFELDGLRTDMDGRIFVTRPLNGTVAVLTPDGTLVREISLRGKEPTNLTFGGHDGKTVFVTQRDGRFIEMFAVDTVANLVYKYRALAKLQFNSARQSAGGFLMRLNSSAERAASTEHPNN